MAEDSYQKPTTIAAAAVTIPNLHVDTTTITTKKPPVSPRSIPSSPGTLQKSNTVKRYTCMCSPTTHAGSFRCRYHRNAALKRNGVSMGSRLSELADKSPVVGSCSKSPSELHRDSMSPEFEFSFT